MKEQYSALSHWTAIVMQQTRGASCSGSPPDLAVVTQLSVLWWLCSTTAANAEGCSSGSFVNSNGCCDVLDVFSCKVTSMIYPLLFFFFFFRNYISAFALFCKVFYTFTQSSVWIGGSHLTLRWPFWDIHSWEDWQLTWIFSTWELYFSL